MNILVLAGGISTERDVSLVTGRCIYDALKSKGHTVVLIDVYLGLSSEYDGMSCEEIFKSDIDWTKDISDIGEDAPDLEAVKNMRPSGYQGFMGPRVLELCRYADVVALGLHGQNGENGRLQAYLDLEGIRYTGTDHVSSTICMDKQLAKEILGYNGIPVPKGRMYKKGDDTTNTIGYPCIVKVNNGGSSVGVTLCHDAAEYAKGIEEAFALDDSVIVEEYIKGREFSVCVFDGKALPIIEIAPKEEFYDYKSKYQAGATVETCPADLVDNKAREMSSLAERGYAALRLKSYARLDFLMRETDGSLYCLEANTLPGMTPMSLVPQEARAQGIEFEDLWEMIIRSAL